MEHSDNFLKWLKDSDALISPKIAIKDYAEEGARLGVVALDDIKVVFANNPNVSILNSVIER